MNIEAEILLHNVFLNHKGEGYLLVGIISKGEIKNEAFLIINGQKVSMNKIKIQNDSKDNTVRIEFEVDREILPSIKWWKLFDKNIEVKNVL